MRFSKSSSTPPKTSPCPALAAEQGQSVGFLGLHFSNATLSPGRPCFVIPNQFVLRLEILADCVSIVTLKRDRKLIPSSPSMPSPYVA
jgi:hypothetical protein